VVTIAALAPLPGPPSLLGESPFWHPTEGALYWCDVPGRRLERWDCASGRRDGWSLDAEPGCCAPLLGGGLLVAMRDGLWRFDVGSGAHQRLVRAPYDEVVQRFNDGKADPMGRFWVGTLHEPRDRPAAALYRWAHGRIEGMAGGVTNSNGLAWSRDARTLYWSDTAAHTVYAFDFDGLEGQLSNRRVFKRFEPRRPDRPLAAYGGRPDGAAVDAEDCLWLAMYEGARLVRLDAQATVVDEVPLPVRCPTMPCFGGDDLRTLFVTTACHQRPALERARQPDDGSVLRFRVDVQGLPVNFAHR
jgi:sugar lactone lactonase YvrE